MNLSELGRLWRTVRHLRPVQIIHRVVFRFARPRIELRPAPNLRAGDTGWNRPAERQPSMIGPSKFDVVGHCCDVASEGWNPDHLSKLVCYNLHYFDDLNATGNVERLDWHCDLIALWIKQNPAPAGNGWEPYPLSLRIVNWIKWAQRNPNSISEEMVYSLAVQARFLTRRLEWHILGNHLFVNAKALIFAGLFFEGPEAARWRKIGFTILQRQIPEQILEDGGQFELTPMYHSLAVEDILDLISITARYCRGLTSQQATAAKAWPRLIQPMLTWLSVMTHPDDQLAFFNDTAFSIAPIGAELRAYSARLGQAKAAPLQVPHHVLPHSGYHRLSQGPAVLLADVAQVGPSYLPGHAHADTLSFELSLAKQRIIVNGGTSIYGVSSERHRQRSTAAHSTLCLEGKNSSEVWSGFRLGRRAHVSQIHLSDEGGITTLQGSHDGYQHLPGRPIHSRRWSLSEHRLLVTDRVSQCRGRLAQAFFHLHPDVSIEVTGDKKARLYTGHSQTVAEVSVSAESTITVFSSSWHPEFGVSIPTKTLCVTLSEPSSEKIVTTFDWGQS